VTLWGVPALGAGAAPRVSPPSLEVTGATRIEYDDAAQQWSFRGAPVVVTRGNTRIEAPEIVYAERTREVTLPGGGLVATPTLEVRADRIVTNLSSRHLTAEGHVAGRFADEDEPFTAGAAARTRGTFSADRVAVDDRPDLRQIVATGQVVVVRDDQGLTGDRVVYNHGTRQGTVEGHGELVRGSSRLRADHIFADVGRHVTTADGHVLLDHGDLHGSADHATYSEPEQRAVLSGQVRLLRGRDTLTADLATMLLDQETAIAEGHVELVAYPDGGSP
jgi:lipopolysaccharide assembly outer membrane protein LptD (OstA)